MDADSDGLNNDVELSLDTDLNNPDTDADGLTGLVEVDYGLDPLNPGDATGDNHLDRLGNADEIIYDSGSWGQASYGSMTDIALQFGSENAATFIDIYKKLFELRQQLELLVVAQRLFTHMGETRKYLVLTLLADLPDRDVIPPDVQEVNQAHSAGANSTRSRIIERNR